MTNVDELEQVGFTTVPNPLLKRTQLLDDRSNDREVFFSEDIVGQKDMLCAGE